MVVVDTPGLGSDDEAEGPEADTRIVAEVVSILRKFGHINAFVIVLKSGQSRWAPKQIEQFKSFSFHFDWETLQWRKTFKYLDIHISIMYCATECSLRISLQIVS